MMRKVVSYLILTVYLTTDVVVEANLAVDAFTPGTSGIDVVKFVVDKITQSGIFPEDNDFLFRIAQVESKMGTDKGTYREGYNGGIWQVDTSGFRDTLNTGSHQELREKYKKIKERFNIVWTDVTHEDLRKPFYSALAARLFLSNVDPAIPKSINDQAHYWKDHYNSHHKNAKGTPKKFIDDVRALKGDPHVSQHVAGSQQPLCYDVFGEDGDMYSMMVDHNMRLTVDAQLLSTSPGSDNDVAKYVQKLTVCLDGVSLYVNPAGATLNDKYFDWETYTDMAIDKDDDFHFKIDKNGMEIGFAGLTWIDVTKMVGKEFSYINFAIHHMGEFGNNEGGILGNVGQNVEIVEHGDVADLHISGADGTTSSLKLVLIDQCWKLDGHAQQSFKDLLLRNKIDNMSC